MPQDGKVVDAKGLMGAEERLEVGTMRTQV